MIFKLEWVREEAQIVPCISQLPMKTVMATDCYPLVVWGLYKVFWENMELIAYASSCRLVDSIGINDLHTSPTAHSNRHSCVTTPRTTPYGITMGRAFTNIWYQYLWYKYLDFVHFYLADILSITSLPRSLSAD